VHVILGLGNPGNRYKLSRHNIGFILVDYLAEKYNLAFTDHKNYNFARREYPDSLALFIKPTTYMNNSGLAAKEILDEYNLKPESMLVVYDDIYLKTGELRIRQHGGDGGHNGLGSIIYHLNTNIFPRLRIGIGIDNEIADLPDFVLGKLTKRELKNIEPTLELGSALIEQFSEKGIKGMLDLYSNSMLPKK
jgi:peptidyl-tRNA hydrolase, PTH1 family